MELTEGVSRSHASNIIYLWIRRLEIRFGTRVIWCDSLGSDIFCLAAFGLEVSLLQFDGISELTRSKVAESLLDREGPPGLFKGPGSTNGVLCTEV
jgi:hypothetical protein